MIALDDFRRPQREDSFRESDGREKMTNVYISRRRLFARITRSVSKSRCLHCRSCGFVSRIAVQVISSRVRLGPTLRPSAISRTETTKPRARNRPMQTTESGGHFFGRRQQISGPKSKLNKRHFSPATRLVVVCNLSHCRPRRITPTSVQMFGSRMQAPRLAKSNIDPIKLNELAPHNPIERTGAQLGSARAILCAGSRAQWRPRAGSSVTARVQLCSPPIVTAAARAQQWLKLPSHQWSDDAATSGKRWRGQCYS